MKKPENNRSTTIKNLIILRDRIAVRTGVENYKVLQYKTIEAIATAAPATLSELAMIKGMGPKKLSQFGRLILDIVSAEEVTNKEKEPKKEQRELWPEAKEKFFFHSASQARDTADPVLSVSEYLDRINGLLAGEFSAIKVRGEITGLSAHPSGYYFALKDKHDDSVLNCYLPPAIYRGFGFELGEGMEVEAGGCPGVWKPKGKLSLRVETLALCGEGALKKAYELLKKKLAMEGLFRRRRPLPDFIGRIGVITSRTGAVIHDFKKNLSPHGFAVTLADVRVEGARAAAEIIAALRYFNDTEPELDTLVIMRGGGSLEDLEAFNNERVAREIFASRIPTIAAIGHDRDEPIACLAADRAVSTPTAAAVLINLSWQRLAAELPLRQGELTYGFEKILRAAYEKTNSAAGRFGGYLDNAATSYRNLAVRFLNGAQFLEIELRANRRRLVTAAQNILKQYDAALGRAREKINGAAKLLAAASPENNLRLGYSFTFNEQGRVIKKAAELKTGDKIRTRLHKGSIDSTVEKTDI